MQTWKKANKRWRWTSSAVLTITSDLWMCKLYHRREEDWINLKRMKSSKSTDQQIQALDFRCTPTVTSNLKIFRISMLQKAPTDSDSNSFSANLATVLNLRKVIDIKIYLCWNPLSHPWLIWPSKTVRRIVTSDLLWPDLTSESQWEHEKVPQRSLTITN